LKRLIVRRTGILKISAHSHYRLTF
jgi:hypothetical protein